MAAGLVQSAGPARSARGGRGSVRSSQALCWPTLGVQTDQESRSAGHGAATNLTVMDIGVRATLLMCDDPDASLDFCRGTRGFEARHDAGPSGIRWTTTGPAGRPGGPIRGLPVQG